MHCAIFPPELSCFEELRCFEERVALKREFKSTVNCVVVNEGLSNWVSEMPVGSSVWLAQLTGSKQWQQLFDKSFSKKFEEPHSDSEVGLIYTIFS